MKFTIRLATKTDMPQVLKLIKELALFEKEADAVEVTISDLENDGYGVSPSFHCFVAEIQDKIEGIALVYERYSTWKGKVLHLEDLIINKGRRGIGLGTALLDEVIKFGYKLKMKRISWEVLEWNKPAIEFYEKKGAKVLKDWDVVHLDEKGIENYILEL